MRHFRLRSRHSPGTYAAASKSTINVTAGTFCSTATRRVGIVNTSTALTAHPPLPQHTRESACRVSIPLFNVPGTVGRCTTAGPSGIALAGVTMALTSTGQSTSTTTDSCSNYFLSGFSCEPITVTLSKAALTPGFAGIDTVDVIAIQRHSSLSGLPLADAG